jgi:hypothetical protein
MKDNTSLKLHKRTIVFPLFSEAKIVDKNTIKYKDIALYQLFNCFIMEAIKKLKCYIVFPLFSEVKIVDKPL